MKALLAIFAFLAMTLTGSATSMEKVLGAGLSKTIIHLKMSGSGVVTLDRFTPSGIWPRYLIKVHAPEVPGEELSERVKKTKAKPVDFGAYYLDGRMHAECTVHIHMNPGETPAQATVRTLKSQMAEIGECEKKIELGALSRMRVSYIEGKDRVRVQMHESDTSLSFMSMGDVSMSDFKVYVFPPSTSENAF